MHELELAYIHSRRASSSPFVVNFEEPSVNLQVVGYESSKGLLELHLVVDIKRTRRDGHVCELEDSPGAGLGGVQLDFTGISRQDRYIQLHCELDFIEAHEPWDNVCESVFCQLFEPLDELGRVQDQLSQ